MKEIKKLKGGGLLSNMYNNSVSLLISTVYSEHEWLPWRFSQVSKGYWNDMKNQRNFMDWVGKQLNYRDMEDWYKITMEVINFFRLKILKFEGF